MPYKDPAKRREADRGRKREKRATARKAVESVADAKADKNAVVPEDIRTGGDVARLLAGEIVAVKAADVDAIMRARAVGYLCGVLLKAIETGEIEKRLEELEESLARR